MFKNTNDATTNRDMDAAINEGQPDHEEVHQRGLNFVRVSMNNCITQVDQNQLKQSTNLAEAGGQV